MAPDAKITSVLPMPKELKGKELSLIMVTEQGVSKKVEASAFHDVRRNGLIAIKLNDNDKLISVSFVAKDDDVIVVTKKGQSIRFEESGVREMGRNAAGVIGIRLDKNDHVIAADVIPKGLQHASLLVMSANGYGKKTDIDEYKTQGRGGSGIKTAQVTAKIGDLISAKVVTEEIEEAVAMSKKSQVIRVEIKAVPSLGRQTQGVRIMKLKEGDEIASFVCL
jgi:DNA gyrase subunit A